MQSGAAIEPILLGADLKKSLPFSSSLPNLIRIAEQEHDAGKALFAQVVESVSITRKFRVHNLSEPLLSPSYQKN